MREGRFDMLLRNGLNWLRLSGLASPSRQSSDLPESEQNRRGDQLIFDRPGEAAHNPTDPLIDDLSRKRLLLSVLWMQVAVDHEVPNRLERHRSEVFSERVRVEVTNRAQ